MSYRVQIGELDISEEAEELREFLYDIVSNYPSGIDSNLLESLYKKQYADTGLGRSLPRDWLRQLQLAGEFEVKNIGGLTTVYTVQKGTTISVPVEQPLSMAETLEVKSLKEVLPDVENVKEIEQVQEPVTPSNPDANLVEVLSADSNWDFCYGRFVDKKPKFEEFIRSVAEFYTKHHNNPDFAVDSVDVDQLYAILDTSGNWSRVMVKDTSDQSITPSCFFVDYGEIRSCFRRSLKKLDSSFSATNVPGFAECFSTAKLSKEKVKTLPHLKESTNSEFPALKKLDFTQLKIKFDESELLENYRIVSFVDDFGNGQKMEYLKSLQTDVSPRPTVQPAPVPTVGLTLICRDPGDMSKKKEVVHIISATDPDNISIQFAAWHPAPAYLSSAMTRDSENSQPPPKESIKEGGFFAAKLIDTWERVQIMRPSSTTLGGDYWVVYAVDVGNFHLIHRNQLRSLTESVSNFNKILLAKCRLDGIKKNETNTWSRELQEAMQDLLQSANKSTVEFQPTGEWTKFNLFNAPGLPYASGQLFIDGKDFAQQLVSMGLVEKDQQ
ncbi:hypothetical protein FO519_000284 [Halicephalobus sp. NKZ332]|nr:hypothetical protein FO519_000284 [Halicephalobus sp. NKZ332]